MLEPRKSKVFELIFSAYSTNLLRRRFDAFWVNGLDSARPETLEGPYLVCLNHSSWWDAIAAFKLSRLLGYDNYVMQEEIHLERYFLFRRLGAFSVVRDNPRSARRSLDYAVGLLNEPRRAVWIFPQGEIRPNDERPLGFFRGVEYIASRKEGVSPVLIALRYEFLGEWKPSIFARVRPFSMSGFQFDAMAAANETEQMLDDIKEDIGRGDTSNYEDIL